MSSMLGPSNYGFQEGCIRSALGVDGVMGLDRSLNFKIAFDPVDFTDADENLNAELLDLLYAGFDRN
ncbi:hypothetical protein OIU84_019663 [Salix udensis]|uniref:Uncharacterized protein n=1 Tax=Salix udensis TaxID=889485 RepID=A0AAD6KZJ2_9ROSI|nr:hypothetical protein OIU84_019663 [Salix udensis]